MRRMKDSGIAWIGEIPEEWETIPLARVIKNLVAGNWGAEPTCTTRNIICIRVADFDFFKFSILERTEYTLRGYKKNGHISMINYGDILFEKSGGGQTTPVGRSIFFDKKMQVTHSNFIDKLTVHENYLDRYIFFFIFICYLTTYSTIYIKQTTGIQNFDLTNFLSKERICLPPLPEQHRITSYLDSKCAEIDRSMELVRQGMDKLKTYKMSVITEAVTKGLDPDVPMKDSGVTWIGEIPEGWKIIRLKFIAPVQGGYSFKSDKFSTECGIPLVRMNNLKRGILNIEDAVKIQEEDIIEEFFINENDILIGLSGSIGDTGSLGNYAVASKGDLPCLLNQRVGRFNVSKSINYKLIVYFLDTDFFKQPLILDSNGTAQFNISPYDIGEVLVPLPPHSTQQDIIAYLDTKCAEVDAVIAKKQELLDKLAAYKKSLIFECVTGKREVAA